MAAHASPLKAKSTWAQVPASARVPTLLSGRACFDYCIKRRQGYLLDLTGKAAEVLCHVVAPTCLHLASLEEYWLRGRVWLPIEIEAKVVVGDHGTEASWVIVKSPDTSIARFLIDKGVPFIRAQVFEPEDIPATKEKLALFDTGITGLQGTHAAILNAEITY